MVKLRISATVDKSTIEIVNKLLKDGHYRNKSHILEEAIKLIGEKKEMKI